MFVVAPTLRSEAMSMRHGDGAILPRLVDAQTADKDSYGRHVRRDARRWIARPRCIDLREKTAKTIGR